MHIYKSLISLFLMVRATIQFWHSYFCQFDLAFFPGILLAQSFCVLMVSHFVLSLLYICRFGLITTNGLWDFALHSS